MRKSCASQASSSENPMRLKQELATMSTHTKAVTKDALGDPAAQDRRKHPLSANLPSTSQRLMVPRQEGKAKEGAAQAVPVPPSKFSGVVKNKLTAATAIPQFCQVLRSIAAGAPHAVSPRRSTHSSAVANHVSPVERRTKGKASC
jgi:hypothetical protein